MKKLLQSIILGFGFIAFVAAPIAVVATPQPVAAACESRFLGIPPWFRGLTDADCSIQAPESGEGGLSKFIWTIVLNIIEIALVLIGYIAVFFILFGGFQYLTGGGSATQTEKARKTILNAVIGLAIALGAVGITNLIFGLLNQ